MACLCGLSVGWLATASWTEEFVQRYETQGLAILNDLEADWLRRTNENGLQRPTRAGMIFVFMPSTYGVKWAQCSGQRSPFTV